MLFGFLIDFSTNILDPSFLISHFFELNRNVCPWSHIRLTLSRLCVIFLMSRTLSASFPNKTDPFFLSSVLQICPCPLLCALNIHCQLTIHFFCFGLVKKLHILQCLVYPASFSRSLIVILHDC